VDNGVGVIGSVLQDANASALFPNPIRKICGWVLILAVDLLSHHLSPKRPISLSARPG